MDPRLLWPLFTSSVASGFPCRRSMAMLRSPPSLLRHGIHAPRAGAPLPTSPQPDGLSIPQLAEGDVGGAILSPACLSLRMPGAGTRQSRSSHAAGESQHPATPVTPCSQPPHALSMPACAPAHSLHPQAPTCCPTPAAGTVGMRARARHLLPAHYNPPLGSRCCQMGFFKQLVWEPLAKTPSRLLRSWKTFFFLPYMSCRRRPGCRRALLSGAPRGSIGWGAVTWPSCRDPPPCSQVFLLPPKEGLLDNFHISSKFGDFRQCWEAWLRMPEAHVEVIKLERGSEGRRAGGSRGEENGQSCACCQQHAWEPRPSHPEKVVCSN